MPLVNENDLAKSIRGGEISSLYYFYGKDTATVENYAKRLVKRLIKEEGQTYNLHEIASDKLDLSDFAEMCESLPMFAERVVITLNDLDADQLKVDDYDYLCSILSDLPDSTTVIIFNTGIDLYDKKGKLKVKNKKFIDYVKKYGVICEFQIKRPAELVKYIVDRVNKSNCTISKKCAEDLAGLCLCNVLMINNEIAKLVSYVLDGEITQKEIDLLVSKQLDTNAFALAKAVAAMNAGQSMKLLDELYAEQTDSIAILAAISMSFIDLYRARCALNEGKSIIDVMTDFSYSKVREFAVKNAFRDCKSFSAERLRKCIIVLCDTDLLLKSSRTSGRLLIEKAINTMLIK